MRFRGKRECCPTFAISPQPNRHHDIALDDEEAGRAVRYEATSLVGVAACTGTAMEIADAIPMVTKLNSGQYAAVSRMLDRPPLRFHTLGRGRPHPLHNLGRRSALLVRLLVERRDG